MNNKKIKIILDVQVIVMIVFLIFIIMSFFIKALADFREIALGLILLMMAYTNKKVYPKNKMTFLYIVFGLLLIIPNIVRLVS